MNYTGIIRATLFIAATVSLSACTRSISDISAEGKTQHPVFPEQQNAVRTEGSFVNLDNLKQIRSGMTKAQVYELLGTPHFHEGIFKVKEWDYIFNFTKKDQSVLTCQFKVLFDSEMHAQEFYFMPANCLMQLDPVAQKQVYVHKELSASSLFAFSSSTLSVEGLREVDLLANELTAGSLQGKRVLVSGYTDRIGQPEQNRRLSLARADSVKQALIVKGVPASKIETYGKGDAMPNVNCAGNLSPSLIECLSPNRRVTVEVINL
ncbi:outer membrane protein assembly factor BamE [Enterobacteriaceae bacterium 89]|nr:outer membrane protein assembly factor BamE [Enterobacteriaceae bacterium 89]